MLSLHGGYGMVVYSLKIFTFRLQCNATQLQQQHLNFISTKKLTMTTNYISGTKGLWYEQSMVRIVYGTNSQWYERSMVRMVHGMNGLYVVRIVRGTNSQWYEKSRHCFQRPNSSASPSGELGVPSTLLPSPTS